MRGKLSGASRPYKFGWKPEAPVPYVYPNIWAREKTKGPDRLVIAPSEGHIELLGALASVLQEPLAILYVLTVPRSQAEAARYQCPEPLDRASVERLIFCFADFFEKDGRHHLWIASPSTSDLLVYDKHNVIYAYGRCESYEAILSSRGMHHAEEVRFPDPHIHNYNVEFDREEQELLRYWGWIKSPLQNQDD